MSIISDIWNGNIVPKERNITPSENEKHLSAQIREMRSILLSNLPKEAQNRFEEYEALLFEKQSLTEEDTFVYAFRLGAQLILDITGKRE